jgi:hypothetical protein
MMVRRIIDLRANQSHRLDNDKLYDNIRSIFTWSLTRRSNLLRPHHLEQIRNTDDDDADLRAELLGQAPRINEQVTRAYPNPELMMPLRLCLRLENTNFLYDFSPFWYISTHRRDAIAAEAHGHYIMHVKIARCTSYHVSYFSMMALIWDMVMNRRSRNKKLVLEWDNPLISALENFSNRDWRIIKLREGIVSRCWKLVVVNKQNSELIKHDLRYLYNVVDKQGGTMSNDSDNQGCYEPDDDEVPTHESDITVENRQVYNDEQPGTDENMTLSLPCFFVNIDREWSNKTVNIIRLSKPELDDYVMRNIIRTKFRKEVKECISAQYMSRIGAIIAPNKPQIWQQIPMNWLNGAKMLMLSDMYRDIRTGQLMKYNEDNPIERCEGCDKSLWIGDCATSEEDDGEQEDDTRVRRKRDRLHVTLHRVTTCPMFRDQRVRLMQILEEHGRSMTKAVENKAHMTQVLKILTECALPRMDES